MSFMNKINQPDVFINAFFFSDICTTYTRRSWFSIKSIISMKIVIKCWLWVYGPRKRRLIFGCCSEFLCSLKKMRSKVEDAVVLKQPVMLCNLVLLPPLWNLSYTTGVSHKVWFMCPVTAHSGNNQGTWQRGYGFELASELLEPEPWPHMTQSCSTFRKNTNITAGFGDSRQPPVLVARANFHKWSPCLDGNILTDVILCQIQRVIAIRQLRLQHRIHT